MKRPAALPLAGGLLQRPWLALWAVLVVETVVFTACQGDFVVSDPLWYADVAHRIAIDPGEVFGTQDNHPFFMRVGLTVPLALLYRAFGVTTFVTNLPCLLAALGIVLVVYAAAPTPRAKLVGMVFCVASTALARHMRLLHPDLPCAALLALSILCLSRRERAHGAAWVAAAVTAWFAAFLVKESALWCAPVWLYAIARDLRAADLRTTVRRFAPALAVGAALAAGYLALCAVVWGDPWARFAGIQLLANGHSWSMHEAPAAAWLERLTWGPALMLLTMFRLTLVPVVLAPWLVRGPDRIWWIATASLVLMFWFGSTTTSVYAPLPLVPRMILPALPAILVLATLASDRALDRLAGTRWRRPLALVYAAALVLPAGFAIAMMASRSHPETAAYAAVRADAAADPNRRVVLVGADPHCTAIGSFYYGFAPPPNLTLIYAADFAAGPRPQGALVRALVHVSRGAGARTDDPRGDRVREIEAIGLPPLQWHRGLRLYDAGDGSQLWDALRAPR